VIWDKQFQKLKSLMTQLHTHPDIYTFIVHGLTHFRAHPLQEQQQNNEEWKQDQLTLGWLNYLTGFLGTKMVQKQHEHYKTLGRRNTGRVWAAKLIRHGWDLIHLLWLGRNEVLHRKDIINAISGEALLDIEIEREYNLGCAELPQSIHRWFHQPLERLLSQSVDQKKGWLLIVRTVKESLHIADYSIFTSSKALRGWIGLSDCG
jgi:hypothetical protein